LRELGQVDEGIAGNLALQPLAAPKCATEVGSVHSQRRSRTLYHCTHRRDIYAEREWNPEHSFVPDHADLERGRIVDRHDQRDETRDGEKDLVEALVRRVKHVGERELDCFASGQESAQVAFRERLEQAIDRRRAFDRWHQ
jgi:hypothetical protein